MQVPSRCRCRVPYEITAKLDTNFFFYCNTCHLGHKTRFRSRKKSGARRAGTGSPSCSRTNHSSVSLRVRVPESWSEWLLRDVTSPSNEEFTGGGGRARRRRKGYALRETDHGIPSKEDSSERGPTSRRPPKSSGGTFCAAGGAVK